MQVLAAKKITSLLYEAVYSVCMFFAFLPLSLVLLACSTPSPSLEETPFTPTEAKSIAMNLWHNADLNKHPKGSCAACHGADFFDLARIGTSDQDILRRALIDGATKREAQALVAAIQQMRLEQQLPAENPLEFRPFQPGGAVLSGSTFVERDIAFGEQLKPLVPSLMGSRLASPKSAKAACQELLDVPLRQTKTGIEYPRWSSDIFQDPSHGSMNDWIADLPRLPKTDKAVQWREIQQQYLENPSDQNFWKMYASVDTHTMPMPNLTWEADVFSTNKFKASLIGQHLLRQNAQSQFVRGRVGFSYLEQPEWQNIIKTGEFLPGNNLWEVGDLGRVVLGNRNGLNGADVYNSRKVLEARGFPQFVRESVDSNLNSFAHEEELRLAWFWLGFTYDPTFARTHNSNSTRVGEYMVGSLLNVNLHLHNAFSTHVRLCAKGLLPEGNYRTTALFRPDYGYFLAYGRQFIQWHERKDQPKPTQAQKDQQQQLWTTFTANGFRASLYLYLEQLEQLTPAQFEAEKKWFYGKDGIKGFNPATNRNDDRDATPAMAEFFAKYQTEHTAADTALILAVKTKLGY
jgi:hypothetical protein